ncbi:hypothetical protein Sjap_003153 [Stephania japonica]|uniref:Uncharacterized protein n=1 Tax=Stephania japonica TaxID=461633 RepID=A0AAP0KPR7_9MAGN
MTCIKKTEEPKKTKEGNKKTADKGERVGGRAQTVSYRKSKELGRAMGIVQRLVSNLTRHSQHKPRCGSPGMSIIKRQATSVVYVRSKNMCSII